MRKVTFLEDAILELNEYQFSQPKLVFKIFDLILDIDKTPFEGLGKPEPLKATLQGYWSRRITDEHRLVYKVTSNEIVIFSCKTHYGKFREK